MLFLILPCLLQYGESGLEHIYPVSFPVEEPYDVYSLILRIDRVKQKVVLYSNKSYPLLCEKRIFCACMGFRKLCKIQQFLFQLLQQVP